MGSPIEIDHQRTYTDPLPIITENMTEAKVYRVIEDARRASTDLHLRDKNDEVTQSYSVHPKGGEKDNVENDLEAETSEIELTSNLG